jgi:hypothetical protein
MEICIQNFTWHNPKVFVMEVKERMGCRLQKSTYGLKQGSKHLYLNLKKQFESLGL